MNTSDQILVVDVNVIIHLEKVGLLDEASEKVEKIKQVHLNEEQIFEAHSLYQSNPRNSVFDYYSYIAARDNNYELLTGDWKLKKKVNDVAVHGAIWYVQKLKAKGIIDNARLKNIYEIWLNDPTVFIRSDILSELIIELSD